MKSTALFVLLALLANLPCPARAAADPPPAVPPLPGSVESHPGWPAPKSRTDVDSVDHLVAALYEVISGPAGKARDWDRFRSLFIPDGRLAAIRPAAPATAGQPARLDDVTIRSPDIYIERNDPYFKTHGFFERGVANRIEEFGNLVHVWSTYESRNSLSDAKPFARGINSIQIVRAHNRLWIASVMWDEERPGLSLPGKYLSSHTATKNRDQ